MIGIDFSLPGEPLSIFIIAARRTKANVEKFWQQIPIWGSLPAKQCVRRSSRDWPHASDIGIRNHLGRGEFGGMRAAAVAADQLPRLREAATTAGAARVSGNDKVRRRRAQIHRRERSISGGGKW